MVVTDDQLVSQAVAGDVDSLSELLARHDRPLRERLGGKIGKPYRGAFDEDDVLQITYLEAFLRIGVFTPNGPGSFLAWLTRIAENNLRDAIRELQRHKRPPRLRAEAPAAEADSYDGLLASLSDSASSASRVLSRQEIKDLVESAISRLPPDYQKVIQLHSLERRSAPEVGEAMGRSIGAVYMLSARAQQRLAELLGESTNFFGPSG